MTPTPEEIALALETVKRFYPEMRPSYRGRRYQIALAAIMEVSEKAANLVALETVREPDNEIDTTCNALVSDLCRAIRNGEHLK